MGVWKIAVNKALYEMGVFSVLCPVRISKRDVCYPLFPGLDCRTLSSSFFGGGHFLVCHVY